MRGESILLRHVSAHIFNEAETNRCITTKGIPMEKKADNKSIDTTIPGEIWNVIARKVASLRREQERVMVSATRLPHIKLRENIQANIGGQMSSRIFSSIPVTIFQEVAVTATCRSPGSMSVRRGR